MNKYLTREFIDSHIHVDGDTINIEDWLARLPIKARPIGVELARGGFICVKGHQANEESKARFIHYIVDKAYILEARRTPVMDLFYDT